MTINIVHRRNIFRATFLRRSTLIDFIQNTSTSGSRKDKSESTSNILFVDCVAGLVLARAACVFREDKLKRWILVNGLTLNMLISELVSNGSRLDIRKSIEFERR